MDCTNKNICNLTILSLLVASIIYLCVFGLSTSKPFFSIQNVHTCSQSNSSQSVPKDELEVALEEVSMADRTVIVAIVNKAYVEPQDDRYPSMLDLFLESFWLGEDTRSLLDHLLVVAVDQTAYDRCKFRGLHCYKLVTESVDFTGEKLFMSEDFIKMMWRRTLFLLDLLKRDYNFIFTDTDVMWLRNPFARLSRNSKEDLQISTDFFRGNPWSKNNPINTGFYYIRSNNKTIALFDKWYAMKDSSKGMKEQDVLASLIKKGVLGQLGLKVRFLDTLYFSGFCSDSKDMKVVTTVHANCCRSISAKVVDLMTVLRDWKRFKGSMAGEEMANANGTQSFQWSGHIACANSWRGGQNARSLPSFQPSVLHYHFNFTGFRVLLIDLSLARFSMATLRNLKIKTATCKRIVKELHSYEREVEREAAKTADMKEKGADPYDLKQQENVLAESRMMIPDCRKRLEASLADLKGTLAELEESNQKEGPEIDEAQSTIADVEKLCQTTDV
ncbi:hypothetical protein F0562_018569 [Nyssa sinensis]|uniref:Nucleotide-diphospho-sugar transferase domain-containing protein n=1 Tax=Nyssa sinensis TaxID=561372 RepID=A0A5J4ZBM5_9ASTE|nr:hypothetical protein F0562_018569 [Nyssa sinensis]